MPEPGRGDVQKKTFHLFLVKLFAVCLVLLVLGCLVVVTVVVLTKSKIMSDVLNMINTTDQFYVTYFLIET